MRSEARFKHFLAPVTLLAGDSLETRVWLAASGNQEKRTVRAERRRPSDSQAGERPRAEAPQRQRDDQGRGGMPPGGSGGYPPPSSGGMMSGGGRKPTLAGIIVLVLLALCGIPLMLLFGGGGGGDSSASLSSEENQFEEPAAAQVIRNTPTPRPQVTRPSSSTPGQTWLVMLYQDADDKVLEQDIYVDLNEAERIGSTEQVQIVSQVDRFRGGFQGDGDWTGTRRYYLTQDDDLQQVNSEVVMDLGEVDMADGNTLVDFATWAIQTYPADKYVLILSDHGMGWPGGWSDPDPNVAGDSSIPLGAALQGNYIYLMELDQALEEIRAQTGIDQLEMVGLDACLMAHAEVLSALAPHARYAVLSQEVEPALGWAYTNFLEGLTANPDMDGAGLSQLIVDSYIEGDQRIVDEEARNEFLRQGSPTGGLFGFNSISADQLAQQLQRDITLTAADLSAVPALMDSLNNFAFTLQQSDQRTVAKARTYAQPFTSIFGDQVPPSYIDLGHFVVLLGKESGDPNLVQAAEGVVAALRQLIVAEKHGPNKPGATGVSIYFPNSQLYGSPVTGPESYTAISSRFAAESLWDDFLAFHYTGRTFEPSVAAAAAIPQRGTSIQAPGAGQIQVSPITLSAQVAAPGQPVLLSADVSGDNIGYIYIFTGFYDQSANSIFVADMDYLESGDTRELSGVFYPDWGQGDFTLEFEWEPLMFSVSDGTNSELTLLMPESYGATPEEAVYTVDGIYTYADGETRSARLFFRDGLMRQVFSFTGPDTTGAPREIIPQAGDTFTVQQRWLDLDQQGNVVEQTTQEGATLTFGDQPFTWEELDAAPGEYIVGYIVEDMDGNQTESYSQVTVQ